MKRFFLLLLSVVAVMSSYAVTLSVDKVYTMSNRNDNNLYVKDTGGDVLAMGSLDRTAYWRFIPTGNSDYVYVQNVATGRYVQECSSTAEVSLKMGSMPVEYSVKEIAAEGTDCFGLASTNLTVLDFTAGAIGWNWKNDNTVQTFAAVGGTNHRSFWKLTEFSTPFAGSVPAAGNYYLYNVATGKWLGDNHTNPDGSWTSHAELGPRGRDIELVASGDGFRLNPKLGNNHSINADNLYMDTGAAQTTWTFTAVDGMPGAYRITSGAYTLGANANGNLTSVTANVVNDVWQVVSREERINRDAAVGTAAQPADMSWTVLGGTFPVADEHRSDGSWQGDRGNNFVGGDGFRHCNRVWEMWNITDRDVYQVVNVPNGKYLVSANAIYVSSANDRMSSAHYDAYINGTEPTMGVVYANDKSTPMINVYSLVTDESLANRNTKNLGNGKWAYNGTNEYSTNIFEGKGATENIEVDVTDGILKVGVRVTGASGAWILFDNITVKYAGPFNDLTLFVNNLNDAIAAAEAYDKPATAAMKTALAEATAAGREALTSEAAAEISAATARINSQLDAMKQMETNCGVLTGIKAAVETQNADANAEVTAELADAATTLANATTNAELTKQISELRYIRRKVFGGYHRDVFTGTAPAAGLEAYLYNVGAGLYLAGGNDWGTHASLQYAARTVVLHPNTFAANCYDIRTNLPNGIRGNNDWLGHNGYVDCGGHADNNQNWGWIFEPVGDGSYRIINAQNTDDRIYLGMTEDDRMQVDTDKSGPDNKFNHWKLVTKDELDRLIANADADNPADATYYIHQPTFSQNDFDGNDKAAANADLNDTPWERNYGSIWNWKSNDAQGDYVYEIWNSGMQTEGPVFLKQTITGLRPGKYVASVTGYYRDGSYANAVAVAAAPEKWAYLTANEEKVLLPAITEGANQNPGFGRTSADMTLTFPDNCRDAAKYFQNGIYRTQLPITVGEDGTLTVGVSKERTSEVTGDDWLVIDNFRLTYYGAAAPQATISQALYATYVATEDIDFTTTGVKAYSANVTDYGVIITEAAQIKKGEPVIISAEAAGTYDLAIASATPEALAGNELVYSATETIADGTQYILAMPEGKPVGFYKAEAGTAIAANRPYIIIAEAPAKEFFQLIIAGSEADSIDSLTAKQSADCQTYNPNGQKITLPAKGVNIIKGKKVVVR